MYRLVGGGFGVGDAAFTGKLARANRSGGALTSTGWVSLTLEGTGEVLQWRGRHLELVSAGESATQTCMYNWRSGFPADVTILQL